MPECKCGTVSKPVPCPECGKAFVVVDAAALRVLVEAGEKMLSGYSKINAGRFLSARDIVHGLDGDQALAPFRVPAEVQP
jgi:hypothetical protein